MLGEIRVDSTAARHGTLAARQRGSQQSPPGTSMRACDRDQPGAKPRNPFFRPRTQLRCGRVRRLEITQIVERHPELRDERGPEVLAIRNPPERDRRWVFRDESLNHRTTAKILV